MPSLSYLVVCFGLFFGGAGQGVFLHPVVPSIFPAPIVVTPWLIFFAITYTNRSFLSPRQFRYALLLVMTWYGAVTFGIEIISLLGLLPPESATGSHTFARVLMHSGWLSFLPLIQLHNIIRRIEQGEQPNAS